MRLMNRRGRLVIDTSDGAVDVERASRGLFSADPQSAYPRWHEFTTWARAADFGARDTVDIESGLLDAPVPRPGQIVAFGLN